MVSWKWVKTGILVVPEWVRLRIPETHFCPKITRSDIDIMYQVRLLELVLFRVFRIAFWKVDYCAQKMQIIIE